jgi:indolepyruvate ferredoxin oxidoreductase alpha subunit
MRKRLMTGNEAIARGAWEAGVRFASAYPGTPSTEILENLAEHYKDIRSEWAPNEKVAMEAIAGASIGGIRSLASMKHVGVNVAADPLFTLAYIGVNAGAVLISADEPGQHSSQNEQDNRYYAKMAKIPMLEPSNSQEAKDFIAVALSISEKYDTPVMVRVTTRLCHSKSIVEPGEKIEFENKKYVKNAQKYVTVPAFARLRRVVVEERMKALADYSETTELNCLIGSGKSGVITSGMSYCFARELFGTEVAYLKLGFTNPLPSKKIKDFCADKIKIYIVEENDPYIEEFVKSLGIECHGKDTFPAFGEMTTDVLRKALTGQHLPTIDYDKSEVVARPPTLCAGCPHRGFFYEVGRRKNVVISGDIGCYSLGFSPPFNAMDFNVSMGSSFSAGHGMQIALDMTEGNEQRVVSVQGDSTFFHSGINSLIEVLYNGSRTVNVILDNRTTGMTGHQENPGSGYRADHTPVKPMDIEKIVRALGTDNIKVINPNNLSEVKEALDWALSLDEPSVIITRWPCVLKQKSENKQQQIGVLFNNKCQVDQGICVGCKICLRSGCPAITVDAKTKKSEIDQLQCVGCAVCAQLCPEKAIAMVGDGI